MQFNLEGLIYLAGAAALLGLYFHRKRRLPRLTPQSLPELEPPQIDELKRLLATAYERMLFLGLGLLVLAAVTFSAGGADLKIFFMFLSLALFIANFPPRQKAMKLLLNSGISLQQIKKTGVSL